MAWVAGGCPCRGLWLVGIAARQWWLGPSLLCDRRGATDRCRPWWWCSCNSAHDRRVVCAGEKTPNITSESVALLRRSLRLLLPCPFVDRFVFDSGIDDQGCFLSSGHNFWTMTSLDVWIGWSCAMLDVWTCGSLRRWLLDAILDLLCVRSRRLGLVPVVLFGAKTWQQERQRWLQSFCAVAGCTFWAQVWPANQLYVLPRSLRCLPPCHSGGRFVFGSSIG